MVACEATRCGVPVVAVYCENLVKQAREKEPGNGNRYAVLWLGA